MRVMRTVAGRTAGVPWWAFSPYALVALVVVVLSVGFFGALTQPASTAAAEAEAQAAACSVATPPGTAAAPGDNAGTSAQDTLSGTQMQNAQTIVAAGKAAQAPTSGLAVALASSYVDTQLSATADAGGGLASGLFLQSTASYPGVHRSDPEAAAAAFFARLLDLPAFTSGRSLGAVADAMQDASAATEQDYQARAGWATTLATALAEGREPAAAQPAASTPPTADGQTPSAPGGLSCVGGASDNTEFDPGNIVSDAVFYSPSAMTVEQIRAFLAEQGRGCPDDNRWCVKNLRLSTPAKPADAYCATYPGGTDQDSATVLAALSTACGVNPQVMLVTLQKESQGLSRTDPTASSWDNAWGWGCPDTGPGGSVNCSATDRGFFNQGYQMAHQWAKYRVEIPNGKYNYAVGTYRILWNVAETGCGGSDVTITNVATASLYVYTPYQPNAASLAAYPGEGDRCSSYGNRNFFYMFRSYFGSTGGGKPGPGGVGGPIEVDGPVITLPAAAGVAGTITAPTAQVATAITAGLGWLGQPYSWGGGSATGPTTGICEDGPAANDCNIVGFDCSGLMLYSWAQIGINLPRYSQDQLAVGQQVPYAQAVAGDLIGYTGHVAMFLGQLGGVDYMLEAPNSGSYVRVTKVRAGHYATVARVWAGRS